MSLLKNIFGGEQKNKLISSDQKPVTPKTQSQEKTNQPPVTVVPKKTEVVYTAEERKEAEDMANDLIQRGHFSIEYQKKCVINDVEDTLLHEKPSETFLLAKKALGAIDKILQAKKDGVFSEEKFSDEISILKSIKQRNIWNSYFEEAVQKGTLEDAIKNGLEQKKIVQDLVDSCTVEGLEEIKARTIEETIKRFMREAKEGTNYVNFEPMKKFAEKSYEGLIKMKNIRDSLVNFESKIEDKQVKDFYNRITKTLKIEMQHNSLYIFTFDDVIKTISDIKENGKLEKIALQKFGSTGYNEYYVKTYFKRQLFMDNARMHINNLLIACQDIKYFEKLYGEHIELPEGFSNKMGNFIKEIEDSLLVDFNLKLIYMEKFSNLNDYPKLNGWYSYGDMKNVFLKKM